MNLRTFAEHISRGRVLKRRLPAEFDRLPIFVSPEASLRYWLPLSKADRMIYRMARELVTPGASVWDVGANVGLFSLCASALAGQSGSVLAIEPDTWLSHLITKSSCELKTGSKRAAPLTVLCAAVSDRAGVSQLEISERSRAASHLVTAIGSSQAQQERFSQPTVTVSLDFLLDHFPPPAVLKIDVETHEMRVLEGAVRLLETVQPSIWCEVSSENSIAVFDFLHLAGYEMYAAASESPRVPLQRRASWDTLAIAKPNP